MAIKASKKGQAPIAVGNWSGDDWQGLADDDPDNKIKFDEKWGTGSCTFTTKTAESSLDFMFQPGGFDGELQIAWVVISKGHTPPASTPPLPTSTDNEKWTYVIDDLTGDDGPCENVYVRTGEIGAWTDAIAPVCDNPDGEGKVFYADVPAHPLVAEGEEDPIPDHHVQLFVQYLDNMFKVGDVMRVSFDYYSHVDRRVDTQSHYLA